MHLGRYSLKGVEFLFVFDGQKLSLFPIDKANNDLAKGLTHRKIGPGAYAYPGDAIKAPSPLVLDTHDQRSSLVLFPTSVAFAVDDLRRGILSLQIGEWFCADLSSGFSGISITSAVLDNAYDVQAAVDSSYLDPEGRIEITSTRRQRNSFAFEFKGVNIEGYLAFARGVNFEKGELPIRIQSQLSLSFQETSDYTFIQDLVSMMHEFIAFVAQGHGYQFGDIELLKRYDHEETRHLDKCTIYFDNGRDCNSTVPTHPIPLNSIDVLPGCIFQALSDGILAIEHLPAIEEQNSYSTARMIMILAALDKTMAVLYEHGVPHSESAIRSKEIITNALDSLISEDSTKRLKNDVGWLTRILNESESLQSRLSQFGKDHKALFEDLRDAVFSSHQKRTGFFRRVIKTRNKIAHGDFDVFKDFAFEDIEGVNRLLLSAQLMLVGNEDDKIVAAIVNEVYR